MFKCTSLFKCAHCRFHIPKDSLFNQAAWLILGVEWWSDSNPAGNCLHKFTKFTQACLPDGYYLNQSSCVECRMTLKSKDEPSCDLRRFWAMHEDPGMWFEGEWQATSGGRHVQTACTLCTQCTIFQTSRTTEIKTSEFRSRKIWEGISQFILRDASKLLEKSARVRSPM